MPRGVYERKPRKAKETTVSEPTSATTEPAAQPDAAAVAPDVADTPEPEAIEGAICGECWPAGWPENGDRAHCSHGEWTR